MGKKLTVKEAKVLKAKLEGKTDIEAGLIAGAPTKEAASKLVQRMSKTVQYQDALQVALEKRNLTPDRIAKVADEAMDASKTVILGSGDEAFADVIPDHSTRLNAAKFTATLMGLGKQQESQGNTFFTQVINEKGSKYND